MWEEKSILEDLQEIDNQIDQLNADGGNLPEDIKVLEEACQKKRASFEAKKEELDDMEREQRRLEREIVAVQEAADRFSKQLSLARNNKEYQILERQIDDKEYLALELDEKLVSLKDKVVKLREDIELEAPEVEQAEKAYNSQIGELQSRLKELDTELAVRHDERLRVSNRINKSLLRTYERLRRGFQDVVVPICRGACGGCYMTIPPQTLNESKQQDKIIFCNNCGRIIFWNNDM